MTDTSVKAPWHFWLVGVLGVFWNSFGCIDFTMTATRNEAYLEPYPKEMLDYWLAMPGWMWALWAIGVFGGLIGMLAMLARRKLAYPILMASFLAACVSMGVSYMDKDAPRMPGMEYMSLVILAIALLLAVYAWWLSRRGVLR